VLLVAIVTSPAAAGCGDWLDHKAMGPGVANSDGVLPSESMFASKGANADRSSSSPCRGPLCQRAPASTLPPAPGTAPSSRNDAWEERSEMGPVCNEGAAILFEVSLQVLPGYPSQVERPPRV
jgi:hypothetical protein